MNDVKNPTVKNKVVKIFFKGFYDKDTKSWYILDGHNQYRCGTTRDFDDVPCNPIGWESVEY